MKIEISYVVPFFNEEGCVEELYKRLKEVAEKDIKKKYEFVFVDDGSTDGTYRILEGIFKRDSRVKVVHFSRNFGQAAAMQAGIDESDGGLIVTMDGDLQHDPKDIPKLIKKFYEGFDIVCGWRKERKDNLWGRKIPSAVANWLIRKICGLQIHDVGTPLRVYRSEIIKNIRIYGDLHRFIPALAKPLSAKIAEVPIKNPPRFSGKSKYNLWRIKRVILDLITVRFLISFFPKPMQFFGFIGLIFEALALLGMVVLAYDKIAFHMMIQNRPLFLASVFVALLGMQFLTLGLLGEMMTRTYYESQGKKTYWIDKILAS